MDSSMKNTAPLMIAIGPKDKENLASPGVAQKCKKNSLAKSPKNSFIKNNRNKGSNRSTEMLINQINNRTSGRKVTAEDLTASGKPGDGYWEQLAESRRVALEATWKENLDLHKKVNEMEYEITLLKSMLAEARQSIQVLMEIANEDNEREDDEEYEESSNDNDPDESIQDASFTSI